MHDKHLTTRAIVLKVHALRESDLIVTLLTEDHGKLSALARGARKSKKRFMGGIDLFDSATFELETSRRNQQLLNILTLNSREVWLGLRSHLSKVALASFCVESANYFVPEGDIDGSQLFHPLRLTLMRINTASPPSEPYLHAIWFALVLLKQAGVNPLADDLRLKHDIRSWWEELLQSQVPIPHNRLSAISESFLALFNYVERTIGHKLHTHDHFHMEGAI